MKKDRNSNVTPILGSYKLGIRFRQWVSKEFKKKDS
jgi:hypothetical protein